MPAIWQCAYPLCGILSNFSKSFIHSILLYVCVIFQLFRQLFKRWQLKSSPETFFCLRKGMFERYRLFHKTTWLRCSSPLIFSFFFMIVYNVEHTLNSLFIGKLHMWIPSLIKEVQIECTPPSMLSRHLEKMSNWVCGFQPHYLQLNIFSPFYHHWSSFWTRSCTFEGWYS